MLVAASWALVPSRHRIEDAASGEITLTTSALAAGSHSITAQYSGDENYMPSTSGEVARPTITAVTKLVPLKMA